MNEKEYILVDPIELLPKQSVARFDLGSDHIEDDFREHLSYLYPDSEFKLFRTRCFNFSKPIGLPDGVLTLTSRSGWLCMAQVSTSLSPALLLANAPFVQFSARNPQLKFSFIKGETGVAFKVIDDGEQIAFCSKNLYKDNKGSEQKEESSNTYGSPVTCTSWVRQYPEYPKGVVMSSYIFGLHLQTVATVVDWAISNNTQGVYKFGFEGVCGKSTTAAAIAYKWERQGLTFGYMTCDDSATAMIAHSLNKRYGSHLRTVLCKNVHNKGDVLFVEHFNPSDELLKKLKAKWNIIIILNDDNYTVQE